MIVLGVALLVVVVIGALWWIPRLQVRHAIRQFGKENLPATELLKAENDRRGTLAQIVGGLVVLCGLYFSAQTLRLQQQGQLVDRINKAVEQLSSDKQAVVLGGIYQIGQIADGSDADRLPMLQVLTSYVEQHASLAAEAASKNLTCDPFVPLDNSLTPEPTVQAVMNALRAQANKLPADGTPLSITRADLHDVDLGGAALGNTQMARDDLTYANLKNAKFGPRADLKNSWLQAATLTNADFSGAALNRSCLVGAQLKGTSFRGADMEETNLRQAQFVLGTDFEGATFLSTDLRGTDLSQARGLTAEQLKNAILDCDTVLPAGLASFHEQLKCAP